LYKNSDDGTKTTTTSNAIVIFIILDNVGGNDADDGDDDIPGLRLGPTNSMSCIEIVTHCYVCIFIIVLRPFLVFVALLQSKSLHVIAIIVR